MIDVDKRFSELEKRLLDIRGDLDKFSAELAEYGAQQETKVKLDYKRIKEYVDKKPLKGHLITRQPKDIQKEYLGILALVASLGKKDKEGCYIIVQSVMESCNFDESLEDVIVNSTDIHHRELQDIINKFKRKNMADALVFDSLLMYYWCELNNNRFRDYIYELMVILKIDTKKLKQIVRLLRIVLQKDKRDLASFRRLQDHYIVTSVYNCWLTYYGLK